MDANASLEQLLRDRHAEMGLYAVTMVNTELFTGSGSDRGKELFRQHLLYWWELEESGNLVGAGPIDFGTERQEGLAILMAPSLERATELAEAEPFHQAGWRRNVVRRWQLNEGLIVPEIRRLLGGKSQR